MSDEFDDSNDNFEGDVPQDDLSSEIQLDFDVVFQQGILRLGLEDDHFCSQLVKYLGTDKDLKNVDFFDAEAFNIIFNFLVEGFKKYQRRPSEGQLRQKVQEIGKEDQIKKLNAALNLIYSTDVSDEN